MKKSALILGVTSFATLAFGPIGLLVLFAFLISGIPARYVLGASYPVVAATTLATSAANTPKVKEELWAAQVVLSANPTLDETPFADNMIGRVVTGKAANSSKLKKAVVEIVDTSKVRGDTINIPTMAGIGGEGAFGEQTRLGTEAPLIPGNFQVVIGKQYFGVGMKELMIDMTVIGNDWSKPVNEGLRARHNKKKSDSIIFSMLNVARNNTGTIVNGAQNLMYPNGVTSRDTIHSANLLDSVLWAGSCDALPGLGAVPMDTTSDSGGSIGELFMVLATDRACSSLGTEPALAEAFKFAYEREDGSGKNPLFRGGITTWKGHALYRWKMKDHGNAYAIGSPLLPRARLGAVFAVNGSATIKGGGFTGYNLVNGDGAGHNYAPFELGINWFQYFSNAPWNTYGGVTSQSWAAVTNVTRYVAIINPNNAGYGYYQYTVNTGNTLALTPYTPSGVAQTNTSGNHPVGSLIVEVNALGVPFGASIAFGAQAVAAGIGRIRGTPTAPEIGRRTVEELDHMNDISVGVDAVWGCAAVQRAGDNLYPGFIVVEHAIYYPGLPNN